MILPSVALLASLVTAAPPPTLGRLEPLTLRVAVDHFDRGTAGYRTALTAQLRLDLLALLQTGPALVQPPEEKRRKTACLKSRPMKSEVQVRAQAERWKALGCGDVL